MTSPGVCSKVRGRGSGRRPPEIPNSLPPSLRLFAPATRVAPSLGYKWTVPVNPAGLAKHYFAPALAALGLEHSRFHDLRHSFAVMSLSAGEHYMSVSKMLGHASFVTTLTVYADYITEGDGGKAAPLRRPTAGGLGTNVVSMRKPG